MVYGIFYNRENDGEIVPMAEHEPLLADLLYSAHIKYANIVSSDLPLCPRLRNMVVKAQNEGIGRSGWQLAWLHLLFDVVFCWLSRVIF